MRQAEKGKILWLLIAVVISMIVSLITTSAAAANNDPTIKGYSVLGRGEQMFAASEEKCPSSTTHVIGELVNEDNIVQTDAYGGPYDAVELGNGDWYVSSRTPMTMPLGTYTLRVRCYSASNGSSWYAPKEIEIVEAPKYVAMGDSFSSGEGTFNYDPASDKCHRSPNSYAHYVAIQQDLGPAALVACSGAMTSDIDTRNTSHIAEGSQLGTLQGANEIVTLTIGGNDAGFAKVIEGCAHYLSHLRWGCSANTTLNQELDDRLEALRGDLYLWADGKYINDLTYTYTSAGFSAPNAKIFVAGYPKLFGSNISNYAINTAAPSGRVCELTAFVSIDYTDAQWINDLTDELNTQIQDSIEEAQLAGVDIYYVSPALFAGHGQCDNLEEWINPIVLNSPEDSSLPMARPESLHPNTTGQTQGYGAAFDSTINYYD